MSCIEAIILILQLLLIGGQLCLSNKINNQNLSKNKGYFVLASHDRKYDLREDLCFAAVGESDIIVTGSTIFVDGRTKKTDYIPQNGFFTKNGGFDFCYIKIPFSESELNRDKIIVIVEFHLKSPQGFTYIEKITMEFEKIKEATNVWEIIRFNPEFDK